MNNPFQTIANILMGAGFVLIFIVWQIALPLLTAGVAINGACERMLGD